MSTSWTDKIAGARMQVDQQFQPRVQDSQFSNQQWGLIMTAVEFEIESPERPEEATLVANTKNIKHILPELDNIPQGMGGAPQASGRSNGGGVLSRISGLFGGSSGKSQGVDEERLTAATTLVDAYAEQLQTFLEEQGRWEQLCETAAQADEE